MTSLILVTAVTLHSVIKNIPTLKNNNYIFLRHKIVYSNHKTGITNVSILIKLTRFEKTNVQQCIVQLYGLIALRQH